MISNEPAPPTSSHQIHSHSTTSPINFRGRIVKILKGIKKWILRIVSFGSIEIERLERKVEEMEPQVRYSYQFREKLEYTQLIAYILSVQENELRERIDQEKSDHDVTRKRLLDLIASTDRKIKSLERQLPGTQQLEEKIRRLEKKITDDKTCQICCDTSEIALTLPCCKQTIGQDCLSRYINDRLGLDELSRNRGEGIDGVTCPFEPRHIMSFEDLISLDIQNGERQKKIHRYIMREIRTRQDNSIRLPIQNIHHTILCPHCTTINNTVVTTKSLEDPDIKCEACSKPFCALCGSAPHTSMTCKEFGKILSKEERIMNLKATINMYETAILYDKTARPCPTCDNLITRAEKYKNVDCLHIKRTGDKKEFNEKADKGSCDHDLCWICLSTPYHIASGLVNDHKTQYFCHVADPPPVKAIDWRKMTSKQKDAHDQDGHDNCRKKVYEEKICKLKLELECLEDDDELYFDCKEYQTDIGPCAGGACGGLG